jgi:Predicted nucleotidyltransferases
MAIVTGVLTKEEIIKAITEHSQDLKAFSVEKIGLFGSFVRNEACGDSDIDLLVYFTNKTFDNYMGLKLFLEDLFNREIDLVTPEAVRLRLREHIMNEVEYVKGLNTVS